MTSLSAFAEDSITLPLNGYYHPGKYMPVHVAVSPRPGDEQLILSSPGAVATYVGFEGGRVDTIVPWLPIDSRARSLSWASDPRAAQGVPTPLKPLGDRQKLVGYAGLEPALARAAAAKLLPDNELMLIPLAPAHPLPGSAAAWESLDAIILDSPAAQRIGESSFSALVAAGTAFAIHADAAPWPRWPWNRNADGFWSLHYSPAGPLAATYNDAVYDAVSGLQSGWPQATRRMIFLFGAAFSILILALALWRPRFSGLIAIVLSAACIGGLAFWWKWQRPVISVGGKIRVLAPGIAQDDDWAWLTCHQNSFTRIRWVDSTRIMFASPQQLDYSEARLVCRPNGDPDIICFDLAAKAKIALFSRRCGPQAPSVPPSPKITSPLLDLVKSLYFQPGDVLLGELPSTPLIGEAYAQQTLWPGVVLKRGQTDRPATSVP